MTAEARREARREGMRKLILLELDRRGGYGTAREVAAALGKQLKHIRPRFTELADDRKITDTGLRRPTKGRPQVIWIDQSRFRPGTPALAGICDGCGQPAENLRVINAAPVVGACLCPACLEKPTVTPADDATGWFENFGT